MPTKANSMLEAGRFLYHWQKDEDGVSSVEYALLLCFIGAGLVLAVDSLSNSVGDEFDGVAGDLGRRCVQVGSNCDGSKK